MDRNTSTLALTWRRREGGGGKTERNFIDFVVDGHSLFDLISLMGYDCIGVLGWGVIEEERKSARRLLMQGQPELESGRYMLYVCPECGDIGCGAVTINIEQTPEHFIWRDFGYENDYEETMSHRKEFEGIGPFYFNKGEYMKKINGRASQGGV